MDGLLLILFGIAACIVAVVGPIILVKKQEDRELEEYAAMIRAVKKAVDQAAHNSRAFTVPEFFQVRNKLKCAQMLNSKLNFKGVYILHNETKDKYYVGQAQKIFNRVNQHFTGKGNGDIYADYKYGDKFTIRFIKLSESGFRSLDDLEHSAILTYNAYKKGYNKNRGVQNHSDHALRYK